MGGATLLLLKTSALWGYRETTAVQAQFWQIKACQNHSKLPVDLDPLTLSLQFWAFFLMFFFGRML